jgi:glutathione S-transferase
MTVGLYFIQPLVTNSARVFLALLEKGVPFNEHLLGPGGMSHLSDEFKRINPRGQVPAMVHDGHALYEGMTMNEYIDETFDGPPLRPKDPVERERMRAWCRYAENDLGRALMMINWNRIMPARSAGMSKEDLDRFAKAVPDADRRRSWIRARTGSTPAAEIEESYRRVVSGVRRIEENFRKHKWVAGDTYSLADIDLVNFYGYVSYWLPQWIIELTNETTTPATFDWLNRYKKRPAMKEMLSRVVQRRQPPGNTWLRQDGQGQAARAS